MHAMEEAVKLELTQQQSAEIKKQIGFELGEIYLSRRSLNKLRVFRLRLNEEQQPARGKARPKGEGADGYPLHCHEIDSLLAVHSRGYSIDIYRRETTKGGEFPRKIIGIHNGSCHCGSLRRP
jgi:hypothetical protein